MIIKREPYRMPFFGVSDYWEYEIPSEHLPRYMQRDNNPMSFPESFFQNAGRQLLIDLEKNGIYLEGINDNTTTEG